jgi:3-hydroxyisobutyrate dehydrogenase-like beta-hydroxyacid dehydrogenase
MRIAIFGLGEAGSLIGADLAAAGVDVHGFDPADVRTPRGVHRHADPCAAVAGVDAVLALTAAADAPMALEQAIDNIPAGAVYADLSTAARELKQGLGDTAAAHGLDFADVALMSIVPERRLRTPALASGSGAKALIALLSPLGMPLEFVGDEPGMAATRKLLRSVVMKGLAAVLIEAMRASDAAGLASETWGNIVEQLGDADEPFLRRLVDGTAPHADRRRHEMEAAAELLEQLGVEPLMTVATAESLRRLAAGRVQAPNLPQSTS